MAISVMLKVSVMVMACMVISANHAGAQVITCGQIEGAFTPCLGYVRSQGKAPIPAPCCAGIKSINAVATTTPDSNASCACLKAFFTRISGIDLNLVFIVSSTCGATLDFPVFPGLQCLASR